LREVYLYQPQMSVNILYRTLTYCISIIWLLNGLFCKVLNKVPRHEEIVARILGHEYSRSFTFLIGLSEIFIAFWIIIGLKSRFNAIFQIIIITIMNTIEFILVPDLLLWGRFNVVFAFLLILAIYMNEFHLHKRLIQNSKNAIIS